MIYTYRPVFIHITTHSRIKVCTRVHLTGEYTDYHLFDRINCEILTYFDLKTSPMWYNHLLMRNLIFVCMRAQVQVREQVSTSVQQRDELDSRINVIFYHLFVWTCDCLSLIEVECSMNYVHVCIVSWKI